jgi:hypothetical protein
LSLRAVIVGLIGVVLVCAIVAGTELVYVQAGFLQLPPAAMGGLLLLVGARSVLRRLSRWHLASHELAAIYGMLLVAALAGSRGLVEKLLPLLVAPNYFGGGGWQARFYPQMKPWLVAFDPTGPSGQSVARAYYEALRAGETLPWQAWTVPLFAWLVLASLVFFAFLCLASLLQRPWMEHERLPFPLAELPLEMMREGDRRPLLRHPLTWIGFALPGCLYTLNGLHTWYPAVPYLQQPYVLNQFLVDPPWNAVSWMPVYISFAAVGLLYLVPGPLLFSLWFFFLLTRFQELVAAAYGFRPEAMPFFPCKRFVGYQTMGAYVVLAGYLLHTAAPHLRAAVRSAFLPANRQNPEQRTRIRPPFGGHPEGAKDAKEPKQHGGTEARRPRSHGIDGTDQAALTCTQVSDSTGDEKLLSDRVAVGGLVFCLAGIMLWCTLAGLSLWWALLQWGVYLFVVTLVLARSTAEGGLIATEVSFRPADLYVMISPINTLGPANMTAMAFLDAAWFRDQRCLVLGGLLDALRVGRGTGLRRRTMLGALVSALFLATVCSLVIQLWLPYQKGALGFYSYLFQGNPVWGFQYYEGQWNNPQPFGWEGVLFFGIGMVVTLALVALRSLLPWWPLHPLGYALSGSWTMILLWFPCLLTWLIKGGLLRYGGMRAFVLFRPLFLGMILGEFTMAILWTALGALARAPAPVFPWP